MSEKNNNCPVPTGTLLIIGGHESKDGPDDKNRPPEILKGFIDLMDRKDGVIEVITTASSVPEELFEDYRSAFVNLGVKNIGHIHHTSRLDAIKNNFEDRLNNAGGVFFAGGDQLKLTSIYGGTDLLLLLKNRYIHQKIVIGGTSAGAMAMSTPMIYAGNKNVQQLTGEVKITVGLEFLKDVCIDTHFVDRSRFVRMAQVVATNPTCIGIGIEENTAIIVRNGKEAEIIGSGVVIVIDGNGITASNVYDTNTDNYIAVENLKVHLLSKRLTYHLPQNNPPHI
ncbi:cyanophycinase [Mucilaginibacter phyllosphaerae]|uniref:Cyanophycinase n=1 Tax=Mucilaginibacter phyllosphaerae TaxID=1812349 RepID=A0ABR6I8V7_9SPHI|nr:cyanophycinase [Mucilaginibacter phyllosphaerae]MBB3969489.1 cyanophycinase [Mucilaginibacter phyllosphaerae]GGH08920.1 cyanophycinase [Mucilaginibacter phyllosphaerae]